MRKAPTFRSSPEPFPHAPLQLPPAKPPLPGLLPLLPDGFKNATTDSAIIARWWRQWPHAMVGAPTGAVSGFVLFDVDMDEEKAIDGEAFLAELIEREGPLPDTVLAAPPRGG